MNFIGAQMSGVAHLFQSPRAYIQTVYTVGGHWAFVELSRQYENAHVSLGALADGSGYERT